MTTSLRDSSQFIESVAARWARLGVLVNVDPAEQTPDLERLLLDTARAAAANSRLFVLAASWLAEYGEYVDGRRLAQLIEHELEPEYRPTLGMMLAWAGMHASAGSRFDAAVSACGLPIDARPLLDIEHGNPVFARLAERRASDLSRRWGRWMSEFHSKPGALRPREWIAKQNPALRPVE